MAYLDEIVTVKDGCQLYSRRHEVDSPRAEIVIAHGFGEHSGRYDAISQWLVSRLFNVTSYDHRGHGQSGGLPGHIEKFSDYEDDLEGIMNGVRARSAGKIFLIGHSMGGLVTLRYLARHSASIAGAVVSAPLIEFAVQVPSHKAMIARVGARVIPKLRLDNEIDPAVLSRDPEVGRAYAADPLVHHLVSTRWFAEASRAMEEVIGLAAAIKQPLLVMHGTDDRLASVDGTKRLFGRIGSLDKELVIYPGFYHELFNEPEKEELYAKVTEWIGERAG
ncbi:MAG TPA: lysophospholipase [Blastocatellia bacterium]|nr:lysophospholipase [Blastocatellia bacterium]